MMNSFEALMQELGEVLQEDLSPDSNDTVSILVEEEIIVQLEQEPHDQALIVTCIISELPPGTFRRNILKDALKSNDLLGKRPGILSYLEHDNQLVLFYKAQLQPIKANTFTKTLMGLVHRAKLWKHAIEQGRTCPSDVSEIPQSTTSRRPGMFGFTG